jgi:hypothetical protein
MQNLFGGTFLMKQPKYNPPTIDWTSWLNEEPEFIDYNYDGSEFIPILIIERLLTELDAGWGTENFKFRILSFENKTYISSSVELVISYGGKTRRLVGAASYELTTREGMDALTLENAEPTSLSESIKNAAKKLGKRFGSELNGRYDSIRGVKKDNDTYSAGYKKPAARTATLMPPPPDITERYRNADSVGDIATMRSLEKIYKF